ASHAFDQSKALTGFVLAALAIVKHGLTLGNQNIPPHHRLGESGTAQIQKVTAASCAPNEIIDRKKCCHANDASRRAGTNPSAATTTTVSGWRRRWRWRSWRYDDRRCYS